MSIEEFFEAAGPVPTKWINDWKKDKKTIGFFCSYIPEEIIHAAGILPIRINARGHHETDVGDGFLSRLNCTFCRTSLDKALKGEYDFLDGLVSLNSCDHVRRTYDNWVHEKSPQFVHFLSVPHHATPEAIDWYRGEISLFKNKLQEHFKVQIPENKIKNSIKVFNETRKLLKALYEKRKEAELKITGKEAFAITISSTALPRETFNQMLSKFLENYDSRPSLESKSRLLVVGSLIDDYEYIQLIEDMGAYVVTDAQCFGSKYFWNLVDENKETLQALSERYLTKPACPRMIGDSVDHSTRLAYLKNMIKDFYVDGVVFESLKFCDLHSGENYMFIKELKDLGVPVLVLDREYTISGVGQMKTRVQAFLEVLA
ncbi:MAG: 2-hydroxyacyl-CoA dehydratase [Candidatus Lokiarchaeota archaeon]|nr:2-hydroxyacyl-CoA dehydratase [Candidatus Lokiarchaeota archaeon]